MTIKDADVELQQVMYSIYKQNRSDYVQTYEHICDDTDLGLKEVKSLVAVLKKLGYVKTTNAVDDEGFMKGSGFWTERGRWDEVDVLCDLLEERGLV